MTKKSASRFWQRRWFKIALVGFALLVVVLLTAVALLNPALTRYVESEAFRAEMEKETAKGLHFPNAHFAAIRRRSFLSATSDRFEAKEGRKAITKLNAHDLRATFNPLGVFLRRWQIDDLEIGGGEVGIQTYEPKPEPSPAKPWFHIFLPDRVYLKRISSEPADVTWRLRDKRAGFFGTRLLITPHGRDFEYRASGGTMRMALIPDLQLRQTHMLITKKELSLYTLDLGSEDGSIHGQGRAGTGEDKSVDFTLAFEKLPIPKWTPESWRSYVAGAASGQVHWRGSSLKLEDASVQGSLRVHGGRLHDLKFLEEFASVAKRKSLTELELNECSADLSWEKGTAALKKIAIEDNGKLRIEGEVSLRKKSLGGALQLGISPEYLEWLPKAETVFTREQGGYLWTTVHLSGTLDAPQQDLSPRVLAALKETPGAFFGALFRALGEWLDGDSRGAK